MLPGEVFFPLRLTLVLPGEFLASIVTLAVPYIEPPLTDKELLGLWVTVPRILFERLPFRWKEVKTNQLGGLNCMLFS